jgi:hypothetical protein
MEHSHILPGGVVQQLPPQPSRTCQGCTAAASSPNGAGWWKNRPASQPAAAQNEPQGASEAQWGFGQHGWPVALAAGLQTDQLCAIKFDLGQILVLSR